MDKIDLKLIILIGLLLIPPIILVLIREFSQPNYIISSSYKLIFLLPLVYRFFIDKRSIKRSFLEGFSIKGFSKRLIPLLGVGILLASVYLSAFLLAKNYLNLNTITSQLNQFASINATNIILIGIYIIVFNSILEEFFWRGFMFKELNLTTNPWLAHTFTGMAFSFHHIMFFYNWFNIGFILVATVGLIIFAIIQNLVFQRYKDLFSCWLIHAFADVIQIFIALKVFNII